MKIIKIFKTVLPVIAAFLMFSVPAMAEGYSVYNINCKKCHDKGLMGAPKLGNKTEWAPRIAKGIPVLQEHAIKGYKGCPAKGGKGSLKVDDVKAAVEYMVEASK